MNLPYTVALCGCPEVPTPARMSAESRFAAAIERTLGGADAVAGTYRAWVAASESEASDLSAAEAALAVRWPRAFDTARLAGMRDLGDMPEAHFELRLERVQAAV